MMESGKLPDGRAIPPEMAAAGYADLAAKIPAGADWLIVDTLGLEPVRPEVWQMVQPELRDRLSEPADLEKIFLGLAATGYAMQLYRDSRPASGAEHHISHMIEMEPEAFPVKFPAMHGEKTGVGSLIAVREYKRLAKIEDITPYITDYAPIPEEHFRKFFGERLADSLIKENENDCLAKVSREKLSASWGELRHIIDQLPTEEYLYGLLEMLDAKRDLASIGVEESELPVLLKNSPLVRNRLTLMRTRRMMKIYEIE